MMQLDSRFVKIKEDKEFYKGWGLKNYPLDLIKPMVYNAISIFSSTNKPQEEQSFLAKFKESEFYQKNKYLLNDNFILNALYLGKGVVKSKDALLGLTTWGNINPKNIKDKIIFVLKKHGKPIHFRGIVKLIEEAHFDSKKINEQVVHNELVKNKRFVLVGRGIYGLSDWGLKSGTVAEIIEKVLLEKGKPLSKDEIIEEVLKLRQVNHNTIILNLQEKPQFVRVKRSIYTLKK